MHEPLERDYTVPKYQSMYGYADPGSASTLSDFRTSSSQYRKRLNEAYRLSAAPHGSLLRSSVSNLRSHKDWVAVRFAFFLQNCTLHCFLLYKAFS